jgi:hypothetical protein
VALIDIALPLPVLEACVGAAEEVGARPILTADTDAPIEVPVEAGGEQYPRFPLRAGLKPLAEVIERILAARHEPPPISL